jgi:hypothetical protein
VKREHLQHVILEIGERFGLTEFYVIGSAAILAMAPNPERTELVATRAAADAGLVNVPVLLERLAGVAGTDEERARIEACVRALGQSSATSATAMRRSKPPAT